MPIALITHALSMMPRFDKSYGREEVCILKDHGGKTGRRDLISECTEPVLFMDTRHIATL